MLEAEMIAYEQIDGDWSKADQLEWKVIKGDPPLIKKLCFAPSDGIAYDIQAKIEGPEDLEVSGDLFKEVWKNLRPGSLRKGEKTDLVNIAVSTSAGSYRLSSFRIMLQWLQGPE